MTRRSVHPRAKGPADSLDDLVRVLGKPEPALLHALLDDLTEQQLQDRAAAAPPTPELLATAAPAISKAYDHWRQSSQAQRKALRGCSVQLLSLAADQARQLQELYTTHQQRVAEHEQAKAQEHELLEQAEHVCEQTKGVVLKVAGGRPSIQVAVNERIDDDHSPYAMISNLKYLADTSRNLLRLPAASIQGRAILYGMNHDFVESIDSLAQQLRAHEEKISVRLSKLPHLEPMMRARAALSILLSHLFDAFECARRLDPTTPELRKPEPSGATPAALAAPRPPAREPVVIVEPRKQPPPQTLQIPRLR